MKHRITVLLDEQDLMAVDEMAAQLGGSRSRAIRLAIRHSAAMDWDDATQEEEPPAREVRRVSINWGGGGTTREYEDGTTSLDGCDCSACTAARTPGVARMVVCRICGNKRCPKATDHRLSCTNSNEPGQPGSNY